MAKKRKVVRRLKEPYRQAFINAKRRYDRVCDIAVDAFFASMVFAVIVPLFWELFPFSLFTALMVTFYATQHVYDVLRRKFGVRKTSL